MSQHAIVRSNKVVVILLTLLLPLSPGGVSASATGATAADPVAGDTDAALSLSGLDRLLVLSGADDFVNALPEAMVTGLVQSLQVEKGISLSDTTVETLMTMVERTCQEAVASDLIKSRLRAMITPQEIETLNAFYASPTGRRIVAIEAARQADDDGAYEEWLRQHPWSELAPARREMLVRLDQAAMVTPMMLDSMLSLQLALASMELPSAALDRELLARIRDEFLFLRGYFQMQARLYLSWQYAALELTELERLVAVFEGEPGRTFISELNAGFSELQFLVGWRMGQQLAATESGSIHKTRGDSI